MGLTKDEWFLKKERRCRNCGQVFAKGTKCGIFLAHVRLCNIKEPSIFRVKLAT